MEKTIDATFDGEVFRPDEPVDLADNTRVRLVIEEAPKTLGLEFARRKRGAKPYAFFEYARSIDLDLPSDFSVNLDEYLYHGKPFPDEE